MRVFGCPGAWTCACSRARVVFFIQHASRMRRIAMCGLLSPTYFSTLTRKPHGFFLSLQLVSKIFLILGRIQHYIIINVEKSSYKLLVILARF